MRSGLLVALLAVGLLAAPVTAAPSAGTPFSEPTTTFDFTLEEDGDANVSVTVEYTLDSANETAAFRDLAEDFERGATGPDIAVFERAAAAASEATGREMTLRAENRSHEVTSDGDATVGVLELTFQWTNFARVDGTDLRVGDAYETPNGTWLPELRENQRLRVAAPEGYSYDDSGEGRVENRALVWEGPTTFQSGDRQVVLGGDGPPPTLGTPTPTTPTLGPNGTNATSDPPGTGGLLDGGVVTAFGGVVLALAVASAGVYAFASRRERDTPSAAVDGGASADTPGDAAGADVATATSDAGPEPDAATGQSADAEGAGPFAGVDEELLSDEERVEHLLEYNGGRMRQANIVDETGWSNAKVSQLLSAMDEADRIDKLRIGRENLISLPGVDNGTGNNSGS
ncbi:helix-turn-helix transcriptional regulator [Halomarina rubra]|uniref:Helix-turn-helix transcriptional regulator n=1 Tax=Halomarina rubra TaxID=2071873 RepID=A0ABD6AWP4_9EURY|nr:hypothetical protein [Halomarina rubra]